MQCLINPLKAELNPICHLLALLGGATIVVVSKLRVKFLPSVFVCCFLFVYIFIFPRCLCNWPCGCYASTNNNNTFNCAVTHGSVHSVRNTRPGGNTFLSIAQPSHRTLNKGAPSGVRMGDQVDQCSSAWYT